MRVMVASITRDGAGYLGRYFAQVRGLRAALAERGVRLSVALGEGDSADNSRALCQSFVGEIGDQSLLVDVSHGGQAFGSVDHPTRWGQIAGCWNLVFDALGAVWFDALIYVETDLIWDPEVMVALLDRLEDVPAVAPMSFLRNGWFYDTWGHRGLDGVHFGPFPPHHESLLEADGLVQISSAGSCKVMRGEVARACRFDPDDAMLGHSIYERGFSLWLDPGLRVTHP
jgi:hypothetical protein